MRTADADPPVRVLVCDHRHYPGQMGLEYVAAWYEADDARRRYKAFAKEQASLGVRPDRDGEYPGIELIHTKAAWQVAHRLSGRMQDYSDSAEELAWRRLELHGIRIMARHEGLVDDPQGLIPGNWPPRPLHRYVLELYREGQPRTEVEFWATECEHRDVAARGTIPAVRGLLRLFSQANEVYDHQWSETAWFNWKSGLWSTCGYPEYKAVRSWWPWITADTRALRDFFADIGGGLVRWRELYEPPF